MKWILFILPFNLFAQLDTARVFFATESMIPVTQSQIFVTAEPLPILLEPNGKRMEYTIIAKEMEEFKYVDEPIYVGAWVKIEGSTMMPESSIHQYHNSNYAYSYKVGDYLELTFTGKMIEWYSERKSDHGRAGIVVDSEPEVIIPPVSAELPAGIDFQLNRPSFSKDFGATGTHKIRIRVLDNYKAILHDCFKVKL